MNNEEIYCIGEEAGIREVYPIAQALKEENNRITGIIGGRSKDSIVLEDEMRKVCAELFIATEDGTYGKKGRVSDTLKNLFDVIEKSTHTKYPAFIYIKGSSSTVKEIYQLAEGNGIKVIT